MSTCVPSEHFEFGIFLTDGQSALSASRCDGMGRDPREAWEDAYVQLKTADSPGPWMAIRITPELGDLLWDSSSPKGVRWGVAAWEGNCPVLGTLAQATALRQFTDGRRVHRSYNLVSCPNVS